MAKPVEGLNGGGPAEAGPPPAVEVRNVTKIYGSVTACDAVDIDLCRGEIHGVLGENGAGKSTLMKILIGLVLPDAGSIRVDGVPVTISDPVTAARLGIGMVHQHFSLVEPLTVWENVALGEGERLDRGRVRDRVGDLSRQYGLDVEPDVKVQDLPLGMRQRVELIKCLRRDPGVLILDEPTSVLTPEESERLFASLREVVEKENRAVVLISHRLSEILEATDLVTIMRRGSIVERCRTSDTDAAALARAMVGRDVILDRSEAGSARDGKDSSPGAGEEQDDKVSGNEPLLRIRGLEVSGPYGAKELECLDLELRSGEIFGIAGVEGNGQGALVEVLSGLSVPDAGEVQLRGTNLRLDRPGALADSGIAVIPQDRHDTGIILAMSVAENLLLADPNKGYRHGILSKARRDQQAEQLIERFGINCSGPNAPLWSLSGGNQQRVVLARETSRSPAVLVASQPTRGLDVGAIEYMTIQLRKLAESGVGVLLISNELDELLALSDRVAVLFRGRIVGEMERDQADLERIGLLMGGGRG